ncbi:ABC transporter permease [Bacillus sp. DJP31]|uniref:ABC transporter permease n=1 Tax=Bacillus sp. DJP31 TaxID=3409789 RepID=UPI003BB7669E
MSSALLLLTQLIAIVYAGDILSNEFAKGTIKMLLMRPYSRSKILLSKLMGVLVIVVVLVLFQFISSVLTGILFFAKGFTLFDHSFLFASSSYLFTYIEIFIICIVAFNISVIT